MHAPADTPIAVGRPHRTYRALSALVYAYEALGCTTQLLRAGTVFQPWESKPHWRGVRVPITLGEGLTDFGWGSSSTTGLFLHWDDFFAFCGTGEAPSTGINLTLPSGQPVQAPGERWPSPFAELPAIVGRLRAGVRAEAKPQLEAMLEDLEALARKHEAAAECERGAMGVDNTTSIRLYADEQARLLEEAKAKLEACRALLA